MDRLGFLPVILRSSKTGPDTRQGRVVSEAHSESTPDL